MRQGCKYDSHCHSYDPNSVLVQSSTNPIPEDAIIEEMRLKETQIKNNCMNEAPNHQ